MIALLIIRAYRNGPLHGRLPGGSTGSSTEALQAIASGTSAWVALWRYGRPVLSLSGRRAGKSWTGTTPPGRH